MKVQIYSTPTCIYCDKAKALFKENDIKYEEFNVKEDLEKRKQMIEISGQMGVPVIVVNDSDVFVGFDRPGLTKALNIKE